VTAHDAQQALREALSSDAEVVLAVLYGSVARDRAAPHSDVDVAIAARIPMSAEDRTTLAARLELRLRRTVDLVDLRAVDGLILRQILTKGIVVKNADPSLLAFFMKKVLYYQADMLPLLERMLLAKARGFAYGQDARPEEAAGPPQVPGSDRVETAG